MKNIIDLFYLKEAYKIAQEKSTDPSTQNGAVLVNLTNKAEVDTENDLNSPLYVQNVISSYNIIGQGANHFPCGVVEKEERWQRPAKYSWVEHAERNSIFDAARKGHSTEGATLYGCWIACTDCCRAIIQAGVKRVFTHFNPRLEVRFGKPVSPDWVKSIAISMVMFEEAGIKIEWTDEKLFDDDFKIRFNGELITP